MKIILTIVVVLLLGVIFYFSAGAYIAHVLTTPNPTPLLTERESIGRGTDVVFRSRDDIQLAGWYFPGTNGKAIMMVHGAGNQNRANEVYGGPEIAKYFLELGYTVLMFDLRGTGESTQTRISFGYHEQKDVVGAFEYLKVQDFEPKSIGIISDSLGAIATIMAAEDLKDAGGIVLDSPATHVKDIISFIIEEENSVPRFLHPGVYFMGKLLYGLDVDAVRPIDKISALSETPLLFLHGANDTLMVPAHSELLLEKVNNGERVLFSDTGHVETFVKHPDLYKEVTSEFFAENLE